jgi:hypothetical protein
MPEYKRARVAISTPGRDEGVKDPGRFAIHVGHAQTLYLGSKIAQEHGCPFDVRLDGSWKHYGSDLSLFVIDVMDCLRFLEITPRCVYWQRQDPVPPADLEMVFGLRERQLIDYIEWDKGPTDVNAIWDDVVWAPTIIVRGMEFVDPERCVGRHFISRGVGWYTGLEKMLFALAGVENTEINVPLITMNGYKLSKEEGRAVHWSVLQSMGSVMARRFFDDMTMDGASWEWSWETLAKYVIKSAKKEGKDDERAEGESCESGC